MSAEKVIDAVDATIAQENLQELNESLERVLPAFKRFGTTLQSAAESLEAPMRRLAYAVGKVP